MFLDILGQILGSNFPTALSVFAVLAGGLFYWFKVLPQMDHYKELKKKEEEGSFQTDQTLSDLSEIKRAVELLAENAPVDSLDLKESLDSLYKGMQRFERSLAQASRDNQNATEVISEMRLAIQEMCLEISAVKQRVQSLSSAVYSSTGSRDRENFSDLRELQ
ncbi:membrane protein [Yersinia phage fHe-Yen9-02]|nr:membrane protein [Yersinia phage fHe-Yen9-02]